jgi:hypothetical protein
MRSSVAVHNTLFGPGTDELPTQVRHGSAGTLAEKSDFAQMLAKLQLKTGLSAGTGELEPVFATPVNDEVDLLRETALRRPLTEDLKPDELLRFVHVEMKASPFCRSWRFMWS